MKLTAILLTAACVQVAAKGNTQMVTLDVKNTPIQKVFREVSRQTGISIVYNDASFNGFLPVTLKVKNAPVQEVLDKCLKDHPFAYSFEGDLIVIKKKVPTVALQPTVTPPIFIEPPPPIDVKGKVVNEEGLPVLATVTVKGTNKATQTNEQGEFFLTYVDVNATLVITAINIESYEVKVNGIPDLGRIVTRTIVRPLDETIVRAYGTTTRRLNTGSISKVNAAQISMQPVSSALATLEGLVPGLQVTSTGGLAGSAFRLQVRGQQSLAQGSEPLIIIDGVPFATGNNPQNQLSSALAANSNMGLSPLHAINPADIESIEVLKDADATAIYGSRGANGVILISTKKGRIGNTHISANIYTALNYTTRIPSMLDRDQYLAMRHEAFRNDGALPTSSTAPDLFAWDTSRNNNLEKSLVSSTARSHDAQISVSGGKSGSLFSIRGGFYQASGPYPGTARDRRVSLHSHLQHTSESQRFSIQLSSGYSSDQHKLPSLDLTQYLLLPPHVPPFLDSSGKLVWSEGGYSFNNPLAPLQRRYSTQANNLSSSLQVSIRLSKDLTFKSSVGYNRYTLYEVGLTPSATQNPLNNPNGSARFGDRLSHGWIAEPQLEYIKKLRNGKLTMLLGSTAQETLHQSTITIASGYSNDALLQSMMAAATRNTQNSYTQYRYQAAFVRMEFSFLERYLLNLSGRRDGSSRFGPENRFSNFGAIGIGWIFSSEPWIEKRLPFLTYGKLRGSFGVTGNDQIGDYQYLDSWNSTFGPYAGISGLYPTRLFNPIYGWEKNKKAEIALELGLFKNQWLITSGFFLHSSSSQLVSYQLPSQTGYSTILQNFPANIKNFGWEFSINFTPSWKKLNWSNQINLTIPRNKLVSFPGLATSSYSSSLVEGQSLSVIYNYNFLGVNPSTGIYQFEDLDNNGVIDFKDFRVNGNLDPVYYGGWTSSIGIKRFNLQWVVSFRKQMGLGLDVYPVSSFTPGMAYNLPVTMLDYWRKIGDVSRYQKLSASTSSIASKAQALYSLSDGKFTDASYIRLRNLSLSWDLPKLLLSKHTVKGIRLSVRGQNLITLTPYEGGDPETQSLFTLPPFKTIAIALQIQL